MRIGQYLLPSCQLLYFMQLVPTLALKESKRDNLDVLNHTTYHIFQYRCIPQWLLRIALVQGMMQIKHILEHFAIAVCLVAHGCRSEELNDGLCRGDEVLYALERCKRLVNGHVLLEAEVVKGALRCSLDAIHVLISASASIQEALIYANTDKTATVLNEGPDASKRGCLPKFDGSGSSSSSSCDLAQPTPAAGQLASMAEATASRGSPAKLQKSKAAIETVIAACKAGEGTAPLIEGVASIDLAALSKDLGILLHAQCTKLSLAAKPPRTQDAVLACVDGIIKLLPAFSMLATSLRRAIHSAAVADHIRNNIHYAMIGSRSLIETALDPEASVARLEQTGILWESCVKLQHVTKADACVSLKIKETSVMLNDAIEDLESFAAGDEEDFDDSASESSEAEVSTSIEKNQETLDEIQRRISILRRTQLLLKAIVKRRVPGASVDVLNQIYDNLIALIVEVDDFACEVQEAADEAYIMELEKSVLHRVEALLTAALMDNEDPKWAEWIETFRKRWLEKKDNKLVKHYASCPSYSDFLENHLKPLKPCIIDNLTDDWPAQRQWVSLLDGKLVPHYDYLSTTFGQEQVSITRGENEPTTGIFEEFLSHMRKGHTAYARDIHLFRRYPATAMYTVPKIFEDDWLNFYLDGCSNDDYRFVYIGSDGTKTRLHKDVVASHSWSTNLTGTKIWTLVPPVSAVYLLDKDGESPSDLNTVEEAWRWPQLHLAREAAIVVEQLPGQTIFVPSTWYHSVVNVGPTLSINQNWINAPCLMPMFDNLVKEVSLSANAICDLKSDGILNDTAFAETVQELTLQNAGMNYLLFFNIIEYRLRCAKEYVTHRPDPAYEAAILRTICSKWQKMEAALYLTEVNALVERIIALL
ncbi:hypothetical protein BCR37DRAFT_385282 [Protomyces lactucae-debilis]|uniref:JmjC domain-containing protein n=1 Tax=Protomyces lactucae-debilis TaxID=2754530 RepID=A0A1Y2FS43_PROLT|nr:uncharacterized protein BCR37DRAFT_385282 [Protomyces lactucae-debilis]ORY86808.1 hypothetical protein BCR37DRAFT_385282 [Protomyces lactucae-debilis]